jgi:CRP-like cAMP-binding protein
LASKIAQYDQGEIIFSQGDRANHVFYLGKGRIRLSVISHVGKQAVVGIVPAGDFFGLWCLGGYPLRMATATAMEPCTAHVVTKPEMIRMLHEGHVFSDQLIASILSRHIRDAQNIVNLFFNSKEKRLIRTLLLLSAYGKQSGAEIWLPKISQEVLAEMIGATRTRVNFFMNKFRRLGLIDYNGDLKIRRPLLSVLLHS